MSALPRVVVVGAGSSGMCVAIQLQRQLGWSDNVTVFERSEDLAGTWYANSYPGCGCDVPSHIYSFSFALNPNWSKQYSMQPEILAYFKRVAEENDITRLVHFRHEVQAATWDEERSLWRVRVHNLATNEDREVEADYMFNAVGPLCIPNIPTNIPGLDTFKGHAFHSAQWDHEHDLSNKRVAIIGNAASGVQIIPSIAPKVRQLHIFQRTPNWITPRFQYDYPNIVKWIFRHVPFAIKIYRYILYLWNDVQFAAFVKDSWLNKWLQYDCIQYINRSIKNPELRRKVTPTFNVGCKRILRSDDYLQSLDRPNVNVITDGIERVTSTSIVTANGDELEVDTIIYATGFQVAEYLMPIIVKGRNGIDLHQDQWKDGPSAYMGSTVPNFPNFFMMLGPNTGLGHISVIMMMEPQVDYCINLIKEARRQGVHAIEPTLEAHEKYNTAIQRRLEKTVWSSNCKSWYKLDNGTILALWPSTVMSWHYQLADVRWEAFNLRQAKGLLPLTMAQRVTIVRRLILFLVLFYLSRFVTARLTFGTALAPLLRWLPSTLVGGRN